MKKRASPGSGHIRSRLLRDGVTQRYDVLVPKDGKQSTLKGGLETPEVAEAYLAAWLAERADAGLYVPEDTGIITVRKLGELFLETLAGDAQKDARSRWHSRVATGEFFEWPLTQLSERAVRRWIDRMARAPIKAGKNAGELPQRNTLQNTLNLLRAALKWAVIQEHIDSNVADPVSISDSTTQVISSGANDFEYLLIDEVKRITESTLLPRRTRVAFTILAFTGARPKDLYLLTWDRVDIAGATILFRSFKKERDYLAHLLPPAHEAIREWWLKCGRPTKGLVFPGDDGKPHSRGYDWGWAGTKAKRKWKKHNRAGELKVYASREAAKYSKGWRDKIGIRRPVALYCLRHTCASQLLLGADLFTGGRIWSLPEIASHLGHRDTKTVERYAKALGVASKRAVEESRVAINRNRSPKSESNR